MRIAYHNPWTQSSENQVYMSMAAAARRIGVELVACTDEDEIEACRPDFVLSVASAMAKITDFPTYLTVHEPKAYLLDQPERIRNLFSYDGYLTISDSLKRFIRDFCFGVGREEEPGFCYLTPQVSEIRTDWDNIQRSSALRVVYFGTNWKRRMPLLFRALDRTGIFCIHGPEESWRGEKYTSYCGPVAFDGSGPQHRYAECGIGLALMDERWRREDVISNRIFEISSVGAVSICPDMPWTRKWFGDSVLYYNADRPAGEIAAQVVEHHTFCTANPERAQAMGEAARRIFEAHFAAERMLANTIAYHERKVEEMRRRRTAMGAAPHISVVLRCGGRGVEVVRRAVDSIRRQTYGLFTVILAKYRPIDLAAITCEMGGVLAGFEEFLIEGGSRAEMLFAGIARVRSPYFAVLDDDDFWMSDHFEELFQAGRRVRNDFDMAFSGSIGFDFPIRYTEMLSCKRNILRFGFAPGLADAIDVQNAIGTNCFVARTDLLRPEMRGVPEMRTAEDSLLVCLLAWRSKPIFSWRPTAFYRRDAEDGSHWQSDPERTEDEISFALRASLAWSPDWLAAASFATVWRMWAEAKTKIGQNVGGEYLDRLIVGDAGRKVRHGIAAPSGASGNVCYGPYVRLMPNSYRVTFLILGESRRGSLGSVDVVAEMTEVLAEERIEAGEEVALDFVITPEMADSRIEFRAFANGGGPFTIASVTLFAAAPGTAAVARRVGPMRTRSLPMRLTARLKRILRRARRRGG